MQCKLIIFDFDGTLADSFPFLLEVVDQLADKHHIKRLDRDEIESLRAFQAKDLMKKHNISVMQLPALARDLQELMHRNIGRIKVFPGVEEVITTLADKGIKLAIVTSNASRNVRSVLGEQILSRISWFECGVSTFGKPARIRKVLRKSRISPTEAVYIGDEMRDIEAAKKVGIPIAVVAWGYADFEALKACQPDLAFSNVEQILELMNPGQTSNLSQERIT